MSLGRMDLVCFPMDAFQERFTVYSSHITFVFMTVAAEEEKLSIE